MLVLLAKANGKVIAYKILISVLLFLLLYMKQYLLLQVNYFEHVIVLL